VFATYVAWCAFGCSFKPSSSEEKYREALTESYQTMYEERRLSFLFDEAVARQDFKTASDLMEKRKVLRSRRVKLSDEVDSLSDIVNY
jgi:hypothetical protein